MVQKAQRFLNWRSQFDPLDSLKLHSMAATAPAFCRRALATSDSVGHRQLAYVIPEARRISRKVAISFRPGAVWCYGSFRQNRLHKATRSDGVG